MDSMHWMISHIPIDSLLLLPCETGESTVKEAKRRKCKMPRHFTGAMAVLDPKS